MRALALAALACCALAAGCTRRPTYAFTYHKPQVAQDQLLRDQAALRKTRGVRRVMATPHQDGSASIEVEVEEGRDIDIQQRLSQMGYQRGLH